jgi:hypothetical protein
MNIKAGLMKSRTAFVPKFMLLLSAVGTVAGAHYALMEGGEKTTHS